MPAYTKFTAIIFCTAFILQSCIYEFFPNEGKYENCLVIYGMITTEKGPHEITIRKTYSLANHGSTLVEGANVSLSDDSGNRVLLLEDSNGRYFTPITFAGQVGTKYKLNIELPDGKLYESDYVEMLAVPGIAGLSYEYVIKQQTATAEPDTGYQFYINTDPGDIGQKYLKWEIMEDFEYHLRYFPYYWDGDTLIVANISNICYDQSHLKDISVATTYDTQTNCLTNYPFCFSSRSAKFKFGYGYGISVRQYALSKFSYNFWKGALENNYPDPLNSIQSYQLTGNFKCITNPDEPVFGIFEASAVKVKGIQVNIYYSSGQQRETPVCDNIIVEDMTQSALIWRPAGWVGVSSSPGAVLVRDKRCVFCEYAGGTSIKPEYWENK